MKYASVSSWSGFEPRSATTYSYIPLYLYIELIMYNFEISSSRDPICVPDPMRSKAEKQRYDGWYNNLAHPSWGAIGKKYMDIIIVFLLRWVISIASANIPENLKSSLWPSQRKPTIQERRAWWFCRRRFDWLAHVWGSLQILPHHFFPFWMSPSSSCLKKIKGVFHHGPRV